MAAARSRGVVATAWQMPAIEVIPLLQFDGQSFPLWKARLLAYAKLKGVASVFAASGSVTTLGTDAADREAQEDVANWILLSAMNPDMFDRVAHLATPHERFIELIRQFESPQNLVPSSQAVAAAKRAFYSTTYHPSTESIVDYVNRTLLLRDAAAAVDPSITDATTAEVMLQGVREAHPQLEQACRRGSASELSGSRQRPNDLTLLQVVDFLSPSSAIGTAAVPSKLKAKRPRPLSIEADDVSAPVPTNSPSHPAKRRKVLHPSDDISFQAIKQSLLSLGWTWVPTPEGVLYCKPHVTASTASGVATVSGTPDVDYFSTRQAFEAYIRGDAEWMHRIRSHLHPPRDGVRGRATVADQVAGKTATTPMSNRKLPPTPSGSLGQWNTVFDELWPYFEADGWTLEERGEVDGPLYHLPPPPPTLPSMQTVATPPEPTSDKRIAMLQAVHYYSNTGLDNQPRDEGDGDVARVLWPTMWAFMERNLLGQRRSRRNAIVFVTPVPPSSKPRGADRPMKELERGITTWYSTMQDAVVAYCRRQRDAPTEPVSASPPVRPRSRFQTCLVPNCQKMKQVHKICCAHGGKVWSSPLALTQYRKRCMPYQRCPFGLVWLVLHNELHWTTAPKGPTDDRDLVMVDPSTELRFETEDEVWVHLEKNGAVLDDIEKRVHQLVFGTDPSATRGADAMTPSAAKGAKTKAPRATVLDMQFALTAHGWQFVASGRFGRLVYCAPHVEISGDQYKVFTGKPGVDYFVHADDFEAHVRSSPDLMAIVRRYLATHGSAGGSSGAKAATGKRLSFSRVNGVLHDLGWHSVEGDLGTEFSKPLRDTDLGNPSSDNDIAGVRGVELEPVAIRLLHEKKQRNARLQRSSPHGKQSASSGASARSKESVAPKRRAGKAKNAPQSTVQSRAGRVSKTATRHDDDDTVQGVPPFRVQFANVYKELQSLGWFHRRGKFGYDYFKPEVDPAAAVPNQTVFHSEADAEAFLRQKGIWEPLAAKIESTHQAKAKHKMFKNGGSGGLATRQPKWTINRDTTATQSASFQRKPARTNMYYSTSNVAATPSRLEDVEGDCKKETGVGQVASARDHVRHDEDLFYDDSISDQEDSHHQVDVKPEQSESDAATPLADDAAPSRVQNVSKQSPTSPPKAHRDPQPSHSVEPAPYSDALRDRAGMDPARFDAEMRRVEMRLNRVFRPATLNPAVPWSVLQSFLDDAIASKRGGSVLVSGIRGSGKTSMLRRMAAYVRSDGRRDVRVVEENATSCGNDKEVFRSLATDVANVVTASCNRAIDALEAAFTQRHTTTFLFLDDVDILLRTFGGPSLCRLLQWARAPASSLVLVAATAADDIAHKYIDHAIRHDFIAYAPKIEVVPQYTYDMLYTILSDRVAPENSTDKPVVDILALRYIARKVSVMAGSVGVALDMCRVVVQATKESRTPVTLSDAVRVLKLHVSVMEAKAKWAQLPRIAQLSMFGLWKAFGSGADWPDKGVYSEDVLRARYIEAIHRVGMYKYLGLSPAEFHDEVVQALESNGFVAPTANAHGGSVGDREVAVLANWGDLAEYIAQDPFFDGFGADQ